MAQKLCMRLWRTWFSGAAGLMLDLLLLMVFFSLDDGMIHFVIHQPNPEVINEGKEGSTAFKCS